MHDLLTGSELRDMLVERWGDDVAPGGVVDRAAVARIVFDRPEEREWLQGVLWPRVGERMAAWRTELDRREPPPRAAVVEVPLLFESGMEPFFDATLVVVAGDERRERWAGERGTGALAGRSARQLTEDEKAARATFVVRNDGNLADLEDSLRELWPRLLAARTGA